MDTLAKKGIVIFDYDEAALGTEISRSGQL